jgi:hypothetical protein
MHYGFGGSHNQGDAEKLAWDEGGPCQYETIVYAHAGSLAEKREAARQEGIDTDHVNYSFTEYWVKPLVSIYQIL